LKLARRWSENEANRGIFEILLGGVEVFRSIYCGDKEKEKIALEAKKWARRK